MEDNFYIPKSTIGVSPSFELLVDNSKSSIEKEIEMFDWDIVFTNKKNCHIKMTDISAKFNGLFKQFTYKTFMRRLYTSSLNINLIEITSSNGFDISTIYTKPIMNYVYDSIFVTKYTCPIYIVNINDNGKGFIGGDYHIKNGASLKILVPAGEVYKIKFHVQSF